MNKYLLSFDPEIVGGLSSTELNRLIDDVDVKCANVINGIGSDADILFINEYLDLNNIEYRHGDYIPLQAHILDKLIELTGNAPAKALRDSANAKALAFNLIANLYGEDNNPYLKVLAYWELNYSNT